MINSQPENINTKPKISVIVCTYNRDYLLHECLRSLLNQTVEKETYEVIVVDNNSSDNTKKIAQHFCKKYHNFHFIFEPKQGLSHARNSGFKQSKAHYVGYIDDDARAHQNWLEEAFKIISEKKPDIFGGPVYPLFNGSNPDWFKNEYCVRGDMGETGWLKSGFIVGTNIFFKKSIIKIYGGFDPELGMIGNQIRYHEETRFVKRAFDENKKVFYSKELAVSDSLPNYKMSLAFYIYSKYRAGKDGLKIWKSELEVDDLLNLLKLVDDTMEKFNYALRKRNEAEYPHPENYIIEKVAANFFSIGQQVSYFIEKGKLINEFSNLVEDQNMLMKKINEKNMELNKLQHKLRVLKETNERKSKE
jgi:glycosyltransferase involved in cell wall biosynthesis